MKIEESDDEELAKVRDNFNLAIRPLQATTAIYGIDKYLNILDKVSPTNNFSIKNSEKGIKFNLNVKNSFGTDMPSLTFKPTDQPVEYKKNVQDLDTVVYRIDKISENDENIRTCKEINDEMESFIPHLGGSGKNVFYKGKIRTSEQEAFGGNSGGRDTKFKCMASDGRLKLMISGLYPMNHQPYTPIAYPI